MASRALQRIGELDASMRIVVVHGREAFLVGEATRVLAGRLAAEYGDVARFVLDGESAELADVLDELRSGALFHPHKLVIVDAADQFIAGDTRRRAMEAYAAAPSPDATLLLRSDTWRPGRFDKLVPLVIKCDALSDRDAVAWCVEAGPARHDVAVQLPAAKLLVDRLGTDLARLDMELGKLSAFVGTDAAISRDDVQELVGRSREEQAWALQSAIMSGSAAQACAKLRELLDISRVDEVLVMWAITDLLRRLHAAAQLLRQGIREQALKKSLRLAWPPGDRILETARRADPPRVAHLLREAVNADYRGKTGQGDQRRNLEALTLLVTDSISCL